MNRAPRRKSLKVGIYLTQVAPTCSMARYGGLSTESERIRGSVWYRTGVPGLPVPAAMAGRLSLPSLHSRALLAGAVLADAMPVVWSPDVSDRGHDFPGHAQ